MITMHELKLHLEFCRAVLSGKNNFEVRVNDRVYEIIYVLSGLGIKDNHVVFWIREKRDSPNQIGNDSGVTA